MPELAFTEPGPYVMAPGLNPMAYLINPFPQSLYLYAYLLVVARQRICEHVTAAKVTRKIDLLDTFFLYNPCMPNFHRECPAIDQLDQGFSLGFLILKANLIVGEYLLLQYVIIYLILKQILNWHQNLRCTVCFTCSPSNGIKRNSL
jgi:hypothetical protein